MGAKPGRTKGNEQKAKYQNQERTHEKSGRKEWGKRRKRKQRSSTGKATERQRQEEENGRNRELSSQVLKRKWTKENGSQVQALMSNQRETPVERLWERSREERKETNRKPSTRTWKKDMRDQVQEKGESDKTRIKSHTGETTER